MGKTFRRDSYHKPKKQGRTFIKDRQKWHPKKPYGTESDQSVPVPDQYEATNQ